MSVPPRRLETGRAWRSVLWAALIVGSACESPTGNAHDTGATTILFWSERSEGTRLYVMDSRGSPPRPVSATASQYDFDWSPDGRSIATSDRAHLVIVDTSGSNRRTLPTGSPSQVVQLPTWSPDGSTLAFWKSHTPTDWSLMLVRADGTQERRVPNTGRAAVSRPAWSPDGAWLAFENWIAVPNPGEIDFIWAGHLFVVALDGTGLRRLTTPEGKWCDDTSPSWSPDGAWIAFSGCRDGAPSSILLVSADGRQLRRVTTAPPGTSDSDPAWSPDGNALVFHRLVSSGVQYDIYRVSVDGTGLVNLTSDNTGEDVSPRWRR